MKSKLFSSIDVKSPERFDFDALKLDLDAIVELDLSSYNLLIGAIYQLLITDIPVDRYAFTKHITEETGVTAVKLNRAIDATMFFFGHLNEDGKIIDDSPQKITSDLLELGLVDEQNHDLIQGIMEQIVEISSTTLREKFIRDNALSMGPPLIEDFETGIAFRALFDDKKSLDGKLSSYSPDCVGVTPVISLKISLQKYDRDDLQFEIQPALLDYIIESLNVTRAELKSAENYISISEKK